MSETKQDSGDNSEGGTTGIVYRWQGYKGDIKPETFDAFRDKDVVTADVGSDHYLFLTRENQVFACGSNKRGQLGIGSHEENFPEPVLVESLSDKYVVDVVCGYTHSAAVCENGDLYCWGETSGGECGTGKDDTVISPEKVEFPDSDDGQSSVRIQQVACGRNHTLALSYDGEIWAWGSGIQLGVKDITIATKPILVDRLVGRTVLAICCGEKHSVALVERVAAASPDPRPASEGCKRSLKVKTSTDDDVSTCAACNEEIFSFTETLDTCIISDTHKCLIESEMSPTDFSATALQHSCGKGKKSAPVSPDSGKTADENKQSTKPSPGKLTFTDHSQKDKVESRETTPSASVETAKLSPLSCTQTNVVDQTQTVEKDDSAADKDSQTDESRSVAKNKEEPRQTAAEQEVKGEDAQNFSSTDTSDSVSPVWKLRPEFATEEQKTSTQSPPKAAQSKSEGSVITDSASASAGGGKLVRSGSSFLDTSKAREYLAKQMEEGETAVEKKPVLSKSAPPDSPSAIENMFSSTMVSGMQQVTNITSKAFSNFRSLISGTSTDMDSVEKAIGQDLSHSSNENDLKDGAVAESSFSNKSEDSASIMSKSANSLNLSPESPRRSLSRSDGSDISDQSDTHKHAAVLQGQHLTGRKNSATQHKENTEHHSSLSTMETELWTWGKNNKGQLGHGDMGDRSYPCCIKMLSSKNIVKVVAGTSHTLALTASSQVYSWGANTSGQLGNSEDGPTPTKVKSLSSYPVWDIAAGQNHSLFLVDSTGFMPDVCYSGKQPSEGVYAPIVKTAKPVGLTFLKKAQTGWIRRVITKGDNCLCLVDKNNQGGRATQFEFSSTERTFNMLMLKIATQLTRPLHKSGFFSTLEVQPYKLTLLKMLEAFISLTRKIGRSSVEMTTIIRDGGSIMTAQILRHFEEFIVEFHKYSRAFCDFLAVGGFEYCAKLGSQFFDKSMPVFQELLDFVSKNNHAQNFTLVMKLPFDRLKEYCRLNNKMTLNYPSDSADGKHLVKACLHWEGLRTTITTEYNMAETTRAFWDTLSTRLAESLRVPKRRLIKDSKACPLTLYSAGRFSAHLFFLFDDTFVHVQGSSFQSFPLSLVWVETPSETEQLRNVIVVTAPEDTLTLCAPSPENKAEWHMALNQAINKVLANQKTGKKMTSSDRLTPPMIRHATHTFTKLSYKDAVFKGYWLNGLMNGQGELSWPDGRIYSGKFKLGYQHGHGTLLHPKPDGEELYEGNWKDGKMHGLGRIRYSNGDQYEGYLKEGLRFGHGVFKQGRHTSQAASIYVGEWYADHRQGYGVMDDVLKGEKFMGVWQEDVRHGPGIVVTLDGMYFEGNFFQNRLMGFGVMLTDDNSCYEGEFSGITQLSGKGVLTMPNGDSIEGSFSGSWNEGLKLNGTFHKNAQVTPPERRSFRHELGIKSSHYGKLCVQAREKWDDIFSHCRGLLGYNLIGKPDTAKAWEVVAVMVSSGKRALKEGVNQPRYRYKLGSLEELEKIPPHSLGKLTTEYYQHIRGYLQKAFDTPFHPLGKLIEALVDVFRVAYIGVGAHPRLLHHAVDEIRSYVKRIYEILRILFPDLPSYGGPKQIFPENHPSKAIPLSTEAAKERLEGQDETQEDAGEVITPGGLLHPILLPKVYPPLFDLYALFNDKEDEKYWDRVQRLNRQGDMALMAYLGIDQKFWLLDEAIFSEKCKSLSSIKDQCYAEAVDTLQRLSTAFSPAEKLAVIEQTFLEISQAVQGTAPADNVWCMDDLFPIFQFVVVRSKIRHLGAEIHLIDDLMESHLEYGEFGLMFTTLKACYFQIQNEKLPNH